MGLSSWLKQYTFFQFDFFFPSNETSVNPFPNPSFLSGSEILSHTSSVHVSLLCQSHSASWSFFSSSSHAHRSDLLLVSAGCDEELRGLSGTQRSIRCIRLAPVFQHHCLKQTVWRGVGDQVDKKPSAPFFSMTRAAAFHFSSSLTLLLCKSCCWSQFWELSSCSGSWTLHAFSVIDWTQQKRICNETWWQLTKPTQPNRAGNEMLKMCGGKQNRSAKRHF